MAESESFHADTQPGISSGSDEDLSFTSLDPVPPTKKIKVKCRFFCEEWKESFPWVR